MNIRHLRGLICALSFGTVLVGCGGSGGSGSSDTGNSPWKGFYYGTWNRDTYSDSGRFNLTVKGNGDIIGTTQRIGPGTAVTNGKVTGHVEGNISQGYITLTLSYPPIPDLPKGGTVAGNAVLIHIGDNPGKTHFMGNTINTVDNAHYPMTFDLVRD
jgi:hypothetical protein